MLRFLRSIGAKQAPAASIPPGILVYAIGDIHGRLDLLEALLEQIAADDRERDAAETHIVLLGDLIDRGPQSAQVFALARARAGDRFHIIQGNHEEMMLRALEESGREHSAMKLFYRNGGRETLMSYGLTADECDALHYDELRAEALRRVPAEDLAFMAAMRDHVAFGDYLFVHAGIRPGAPIEAQRGADLRWIREPFLSSRDDHGAIVVHGHTITEEVVERPNRIGLDTGAYRSGVLTAMGVEAARRWFLHT